MRQEGSTVVNPKRNLEKSILINKNSRKSKLKRKINYIKKNYQLYLLFSLPPLILLIVFKYIPIGGILIASCVGNSSNKSQNDKKINPADTIYLGDLREKFEGDSVFFAKVAPDLILTDYQYFWAATESDAIANGLTKDYYKKVKQEITATNEAIKKGVMKGANVKRIPDFQSVK